LNTPFPGIQIKALAIRDSSQIKVFLSGTRASNVMMIQKNLKRERTALLSELPRLARNQGESFRYSALGFKKGGL
jgi:hypothetical protein